jgi:hypothetical protein
MSLGPLETGGLQVLRVDRASSALPAQQALPRPSLALAALPAPRPLSLAPRVREDSQDPQALPALRQRFLDRRAQLALADSLALNRLSLDLRALLA